MKKVIRIILFLPYLLIISCLILNYINKYHNDFYIRILPLLYENIGYGAMYNIAILIVAFHYRMCLYFKSAIFGLLLMNIIGTINYFYPIIGGVMFLGVFWSKKDIYEIVILFVTFFVTSLFIIRENILHKIWI